MWKNENLTLRCRERRMAQARRQTAWQLLKMLELPRDPQFYTQCMRSDEMKTCVPTLLHKYSEWRYSS